MIRGNIFLTLKNGMNSLSEAQILEPKKEAVDMLANVLNKDRTFLYAHPEFDVNPKQLKAFKKFVGQRARRLPLSYVLGQCDFLDLSLEVDSRVLVPRPETEILAKAMIAKYKHVNSSNPQFLDLGTGCGCLALSLAKNLKATVWASDISKGALKVASENVKRQNLSKNIRLIHGDLFKPFSNKKFHGFFSGIISNPPYVSLVEQKQLMPEVLKEPRIALFAGKNGLNVIEKIVAQAPRYLKRGGWLGLEIGRGQRNQISQWLIQSGFSVQECHQDLLGIDRVILAKK